MVRAAPAGTVVSGRVDLVVPADGDPRRMGILTVVKRVPDSRATIKVEPDGSDIETAGVSFQMSASLQVMCLHVAELLVDRRWSSGLSGSGTVARCERSTVRTGLSLPTDRSVV